MHSKYELRKHSSSLGAELRVKHARMLHLPLHPSPESDLPYASDTSRTKKINDISTNIGAIELKTKIYREQKTKRSYPGSL